MGGLFSRNNENKKTDLLEKYKKKIEILKKKIKKAEKSTNKGEIIKYIIDEKIGIISLPIQTILELQKREENEKETWQDGNSINFNIVIGIIAEVIDELNKNNNKENNFAKQSFNNYIKDSIITHLVAIILNDNDNYDAKIFEFLKKCVKLEENEFSNFNDKIRDEVVKQLKKQPKDFQFINNDRLIELYNNIDEKIIELENLNKLKLVGGQYTEEQFLAKYKKYKQKYIQLQRELRQ